MIFPILILKKCKTQPPVNQLIRKNMGGGKILVKKLHMSKKSCNFAFELENYQFYHNNGVSRKS
jgi:hypothetical protein